jgi:excisionase family DNA binding protein
MRQSIPFLLTVTELAALLRVEKQTVERWARRGALPAIRMQGRYRFRRDEVEVWLQTRGIRE